MTLDFGRLCSVAPGALPPFQPLAACHEQEQEPWAADSAALPGQLGCAGQLVVPRRP